MAITRGGLATRNSNGVARMFYPVVMNVPATDGSNDTNTPNLPKPPDTDCPKPSVTNCQSLKRPSLPESNPIPTKILSSTSILDASMDDNASECLLNTSSSSYADLNLDSLLDAPVPIIIKMSILNLRQFPCMRPLSIWALDRITEDYERGISPATHPYFGFGCDGERLVYIYDGNCRLKAFSNLFSSGKVDECEVCVSVTTVDRHTWEKITTSADSDHLHMNPVISKSCLLFARNHWLENKPSEAEIIIATQRALSNVFQISVDEIYNIFNRKQNKLVDFLKTSFGLTEKSAKDVSSGVMLDSAILSILLEIEIKIREKASQNSTSFTKFSTLCIYRAAKAKSKEETKEKLVSALKEIIERPLMDFPSSKELLSIIKNCMSTDDKTQETDMTEQQLDGNSVAVSALLEKRREEKSNYWVLVLYEEAYVDFPNQRVEFMKKILAQESKFGVGFLGVDALLRGTSRLNLHNCQIANIYYEGSKVAGEEIALSQVTVISSDSKYGTAVLNLGKTTFAPTRDQAIAKIIAALGKDTQVIWGNGKDQGQILKI